MKEEFGQPPLRISEREKPAQPIPCASVPPNTDSTLRYEQQWASKRQASLSACRVESGHNIKLVAAKRPRAMKKTFQSFREIQHGIIILAKVNAQPSPCFP